MALNLNTGFRTSSNMVVAGGIVNAIVDLLQGFYPEFVVSPEIRTYATLAVCWAVARISKTPQAPGKL